MLLRASITRASRWLWGYCTRGADFIGTLLKDAGWYHVRDMCISRGEVNQGSKILLCCDINLNCVIESRHDKFFWWLIIGITIDIPKVMCSSSQR